MHIFWGWLTALLSIFAATVLSGFRLQPYVAAGMELTPPTLALYPALLAATLAGPTTFLLYVWRRRRRVYIGPVSFDSHQFFACMWSLLYMGIAIALFSYQENLHQHVFRVL